MNRRAFLLSLPAVAVAAKIAAEAKVPADWHGFTPSQRCVDFFGTDDLELQRPEGKSHAITVYGSNGKPTAGHFCIIWQRRGARSGRDDFYLQTHRGDDLTLISETPYRMARADPPEHRIPFVIGPGGVRA